MEIIKKIPIFLPDEEAQKFLLFQKYYQPFMLMIEKGVFTVKNGNIVLHFDELGVLQTIQRNDFLYSRRHEISKGQ